MFIPDLCGFAFFSEMRQNGWQVLLAETGSIGGISTFSLDGRPAACLPAEEGRDDWKIGGHGHAPMLHRAGAICCVCGLFALYIRVPSSNILDYEKNTAE